MPGTFWRHCSQSRLYSDETTWRPRWKIALENTWKCHFRESKFENVPRCLGPQEELVLLVRFPKQPIIHYQPATWKLFDSPVYIKNKDLSWLQIKCHFSPAPFFVVHQGLSLLWFGCFQIAKGKWLGSLPSFKRNWTWSQTSLLQIGTFAHLMLDSLRSSHSKDPCQDPWLSGPLQWFVGDATWILSEQFPAQICKL